MVSFTKLFKKRIHSQSTKFIWVSNFEVENDWSSKQNLIKLPQVQRSNVRSLISSLSEFSLLLAEPEDIVLLKDRPDKKFIEYLENLGITLPLIVTPKEWDYSTTLTNNILKDKDCIQFLRKISNEKTYSIMTHGTSSSEEILSAITKIPLATPLSSIFEKVNSKIFSRILCEKSNICQVQGGTALCLEELERLFVSMKNILKYSPLVLKESMGVSGKGQVIINDNKRFEQLLRSLYKSAEKRGHSKIEMILEQWVPKIQDINYQFYIDKDGVIGGAKILSALVKNSTHLGHLYPHQLSKEDVHKIQETMKIIGGELFKQGYYGVVGIDAIIDKEKILYPCLEINARLNMSTYHRRIYEEVIPKHTKVVSTYINLSKTRPISFSELYEELKDLIYKKGSKNGIIINAFSPLNPDYSENLSYSRLYVMIAGQTFQECYDIKKNLIYRLKNMKMININER